MRNYGGLTIGSPTEALPQCVGGPATRGRVKQLNGMMNASPSVASRVGGKNALPIEASRADGRNEPTMWGKMLQ